MSNWEPAELYCVLCPDTIVGAKDTLWLKYQIWPRLACLKFVYLPNSLIGIKWHTPVWVADDQELRFPASVEFERIRQNGRTREWVQDDFNYLKTLTLVERK